jgi:hypothetical protein
VAAPALQDAVPIVSSLVSGEEVIVLLKKDPITNYPWWARWLLLAVYWITNYDGGIQLVTVCTSEEQARSFAKHAGYRGIWLIVGEPLPDEPCQWRPAIHFKSPFSQIYEKHAPDLITVKRSEFEELQGAIASLHGAYHT